MSEKAIGLSAAAATALYTPSETVWAIGTVATGVQWVLQYTWEAVNNVIHSATWAKIWATAPFIPLAAEAFWGATMWDWINNKTLKWESTTWKAIFRIGWWLLALSNPLVGSLAMWITWYKLWKYTLGKTWNWAKWAWNKLKGVNNTSYKPKEEAA